MLLTTINNAGANAEPGGCWRVIGRRPIGSSFGWTVPINIEVDGTDYTLGFQDIVPGGDNPDVTDWLDCDYDYAFRYSNVCEESVPRCSIDAAMYIFDVEDCCGCNPPDLVITDFGGCWIGTLSGSCVTTGSTQYFWERSCDGGLNWSTYTCCAQNLINVSDNCMYRVSILNCADGCYRTSNVITATCGGGPNCNSTLNVGKTGCDFIRLNDPCGLGNYSSWSIIRNGTITAFSGTGSSPAVTTITTDGDYHMIVECVDGCVYESGVLTFTGCGNDCTCEGSVTFNPVTCTLIFANPVGCDSAFWSYQWKFAPLATGAPQNIFGANGLTYEPQFNGFYWFELSDNSGTCPDVLLGPIEVDCVEPPTVCDCTATISGCNPITLATSGDCDQYNIRWQRNTGGGWSTVQIGDTSYIPNQSADYRVWMDSIGVCSDVFSNTVTCGFPQCSPTITSMTINDDCDIVVTWADCNGTPANVQWSWAQVNNTPGDCNGSGGWNSFGTGSVVTNALANGTGTTTLTPAQGDRCYRVLIDCGSNGCSPFVTGFVWWEECSSSCEPCTINVTQYKDGYLCKNAYSTCVGVLSLDGWSIDYQYAEYDTTGSTNLYDTIYSDCNTLDIYPYTSISEQDWIDMTNQIPIGGSPGKYRIVASKLGCPDIISNEACGRFTTIDGLIDVSGTPVFNDPVLVGVLGVSCSGGNLNVNFKQQTFKMSQDCGALLYDKIIEIRITDCLNNVVSTNIQTSSIVFEYNNDEDVYQELYSMPFDCLTICAGYTIEQNVYYEYTGLYSSFAPVGGNFHLQNLQPYPGTRGVPFTQSYTLTAQDVTDCGC